MEEETKVEIETEVESENEDMGNDFYSIDSGGVFDKEDIYQVDLPKINIENLIKNKKTETSSIIVSFLCTEKNPGVIADVHQAINTLNKFDIQFLDEQEQIKAVMKFVKPYICGIDYGIIRKEKEEVRLIRCEIQFEDFTVTKV